MQMYDDPVASKRAKVAKAKGKEMQGGQEPEARAKAKAKGKAKAEAKAKAKDQATGGEVDKKNILRKQYKD